MVALAALVGVAGIAAQVCVVAPASADYRSAGSVSGARSVASDSAAAAAAFAEAQIGKPYSWGASGPMSFDSAGLVQAAYASVGVSLPHSAAGQAALATVVYRSDLQVGDLVFYNAGSAVAIYVGDDEIVGIFTVGTRVHPADIDSMPIFSFGRVVI
jgi:cell wall-associated NlpC family hydrolase